ncbi:MAG: Methionine synthase [Alphaproteobacteria bacterium MarineAlpha5_Bin9]|nr:MAG: Methionine synthase [Alphaproteobacteria bacterium MarineAlpha5_Bin9]
METFTEKIINNNNNLLLIDGATGTEFQKRGIVLDNKIWTGLAGYTHPKILEEIHESYIKSGSKIITTNTFASAKHNIHEVDKNLDFKEINLKTIQCAINAREKYSHLDIKIAGSLSLAFTANRYEIDTFPSICSPSYEELLNNFREQINLFIQKNVDLIILEMIAHPQSSEPLIQATIESGLPYWIGISGGATNANGDALAFSANTLLLKEVISKLPNSAEATLLMHTEIDNIDNCLKVLKNNSLSKYNGVYPHSGDFKIPTWDFDKGYTPKLFLNDIKKWVDSYDLKIIGGCCGISSQHIKKLKKNLIAS